MIDYLLFNNTKLDVNLLKNSIMYSKPKLRYGHFKMQQVLYTVLYNSNICINRNFQNSLKISVHVILIPRYEFDIVVITRVRGEAEYEC